MYGTYMIPYIYLSSALPQVWAQDHARPHNSPSTTGYIGVMYIFKQPVMRIDHLSSSLLLLLLLLYYIEHTNTIDVVHL